MVLSKTIEHISFSLRDQEIFHDSYAKFSYSLNFIKFINNSSSDAFHSIFDMWSVENTKILASLDSTSKKEYEILKKLLKKNPPSSTRKRTIKSIKIQKLMVRNENQAFIHYNLPDFINESCISYLVMLFENYIKSTLKLLIVKNPKGLMQSNKELKIRDIGASKTYNDILQIAITKEIESIIDGGIDQIYEYLKKNKLDLKKYKNWPNFREIFLRRNLLVHNSGFPDTVYSNKLNKKLSKKRLTVTTNYVNTSITLFDSFAHLITDFFETKYTAKKNIFSF